jgi:hypothetical protein
MMVKKPLIYYDNVELVKYNYGDLLLPSDVYHYVQDGIKTSSTVILPMGFFSFSNESDDGKYWYYKAKEYYKIYCTMHNEKCIRLYIEPLIHDKRLIPYIIFPKGIDKYIDQKPNEEWSVYLVVDYDGKNDMWVVRRTVHVTFDSIPYIQSIEKRGKTFFFGVLTLFPKTPYRIAFSNTEINKALSTLPQDVCNMLSSTEKCWSWLLNYLDDVKVVYLFGKGHDVAVGYAVTDWIDYFIAGYVK